MSVLDKNGLGRVWGKTTAALDSLNERLKTHNHDSRYYTETEVDSKINGHNHDGRYYTETEMDSKLGGKAPLDHNHDDRYYDWHETEEKLKSKANTGCGSYASLFDFVSYVATANKGMTYIGKWMDTGKWGPRGVTSWYRGFCILQNAPGSTYSVDGIILCQSGNNYWLGYLSGTSTVAVDWKKLPTLMNNTVWVHDALQKLYIAASSETNYRLFLGVSDSAWRLSPAVSGQLQLGGANYKWGQIFATSSTISTSDREEKHDINSLEDSVKDFILGLNPVSYKFNDGTSGRTHFGMIAQDVEELMVHQGISSMDFAGFIKSPKIKTVTDEEGTVIEEKVIENEYLYGLRYEEFIAPIIKTIQLQQKEINALNERINKLEGGISWN